MTATPDLILDPLPMPIHPRRDLVPLLGREENPLVPTGVGFVNPLQDDLA